MHCLLRAGLILLFIANVNFRREVLLIGAPGRSISFI